LASASPNSSALALQRLELGEPFRLGRGVALGFAELHQRRRVVEVAFDLGERAEAVFQHGAFAHQLLRGLRIAPQRRVFGFGVEFGQSARRSVDVKDASSAVPRTA
jgi:hypothetical protein